MTIRVYRMQSRANFLKRRPTNIKNNFSNRYINIDLPLVKFTCDKIARTFQKYLNLATLFNYGFTTCNLFISSIFAN